ncbi:MAG: hypothetical protein IJI44_07245 [Erysipelotrichaceae bacterium]|nr:hypothetical protein [Erysipelotrichaceae bacterium]
MENKGNRKKIRLGVLTGLTSLSVLIGSVFDSSKDLLEETHVNPKAISEIMTDLSEDNLESRKQKQGIKEKIRKLIYKVPVKIRVVLFLPLWLLGNLILAAAEFLFKTLLAPIGNLILGFVFQTLLLFGIIGICIKIMFPDLPWSKIFSKKLILLVFAGSLFMSACDLVMPMIWEKYTLYRRISKLILGLIVILIILRPFIRKKLKNRVRYEASFNGETFELN